MVYRIADEKSSGCILTSLTQVVTALIGGVYAFIIAAALRKTSLGKQD
ncbi:MULTISPECIES: hypothetical protein [unclassified Roseburia]|nr:MULTISPECIES: hypothetical protein [unclassified Roseburia]